MEFVRPGHLERSLNDALVRAFAQETLIGTLAQEQIQGAYDHGLAGPRLPGNHIQPGRELHLKGVNQGQVFDEFGEAADWWVIPENEASRFVPLARLPAVKYR